MKRIQNILQDASFQKAITDICEFEKDRIYCKHDLTHALDVARIAYILKLEENINSLKEWIYAAALLHDIGRAEEYLNGEPHNIAGQKLAMPILRAAGFSEGEVSLIVCAINEHREITSGSMGNSLQDIISRADKLSRDCISCNASETCKWDESRKTAPIEY